MSSLVGRALFSALMGLCAALALPDVSTATEPLPTPEVAYVPPSPVLLPAGVPVPPAVPAPEVVPCPAEPAPGSVDGVVSHVLGKVDPLVDLTASGVIASALIIAALLWLRSAFASRFAPEPSTETSRLWNLGAALAIGLGLGLVSVAPAIPIPGRVLEGGTLIAARLFGGFIAATAAVFGRDFFVRSKGMVSEKKEARIAAGMTTGQFRALRDDTTEPKP